MNFEGAGAGMTGAATLEATKKHDSGDGDTLGVTMAGDDEHDLMQTSDLDKFKTMSLGYDSEEGDEATAPL